MQINIHKYLHTEIDKKIRIRINMTFGPVDKFFLALFSNFLQSVFSYLEFLILFHFRKHFNSSNII